MCRKLPLSPSGPVPAQALLRLQEHADEEEKDGSKEATTTRTLSYCPTHVAHVFARVEATPIASASIAQV